MKLSCTIVYRHKQPIYKAFVKGEAWWANPPLSGLLTITETPTICNYEREFGSEEPYNRRARMTRKESTLPKLLTPKTITKIGTWNVRSMYEAGKAAITISVDWKRWPKIVSDGSALLMAFAPLRSKGR